VLCSNDEFYWNGCNYITFCQTGLTPVKWISYFTGQAGLSGYFCHHQFPGLPRHSPDSSGRRREEIDDTDPMKLTKYFIGQAIHLR
jgi:hypothetical protein